MRALTLVVQVILAGGAGGLVYACVRDFHRDGMERVRRGR